MGRITAVVFGGIVLGIVVLAAVSASLGFNGPDVEPASTPSGFPVPAAQPSPAPTSPAVPDRGPNGMPIEHEPDRELRTEGLETPRPVEPDANGDRWNAKRREANDAWVRNTLAVSETFVTETVPDPQAKAAVRAAIQTFTTDITRTRTLMVTRGIPLSEGRAAMAASRNRVAEEVTAAIGATSAEALRSKLASSQLGGGW